MIDHYQFRFVQNSKETNNSRLYNKRLYSFKSSKSNEIYWVWVECYDLHMYAVKFHLKRHRNSPNKYSVMTGLGEPRRIINTCVAIMLEIAKEDPRSSFGFIGSNMEGEGICNTKRFRIYKILMLTYFSDRFFQHKTNYEKSAYLLIRKSELANNPHLMDDIESFFTEEYEYFE